MVVTVFSKKTDNKDPWPQANSFKVLICLKWWVRLPQWFPSEREALWFIKSQKQDVCTCMHKSRGTLWMLHRQFMGSALLILHQSHIYLIRLQAVSIRNGKPAFFFSKCKSVKSKGPLKYTWLPFGSSLIVQLSENGYRWQKSWLLVFEQPHASQEIWGKS